MKMAFYTAFSAGYALLFHLTLVTHYGPTSWFYAISVLAGSYGALMMKPLVDTLADHPRLKAFVAYQLEPGPQDPFETLRIIQDKRVAEFESELHRRVAEPEPVTLDLEGRDGDVGGVVIYEYVHPEDP